MATLHSEICQMLYANAAYFTHQNLDNLYCAVPADHHGTLIYIQDYEEDELLPFSLNAKAILRMAMENDIAWIRLDPDCPEFDDYPIDDCSDELSPSKKPECSNP